MNPTPYKLQKTDVRMDDGRTLSYYDYAAQNQMPPYLSIHQNAAQADPPTGPRVLEQPAEMRWNPTRAEWTVYAAARMNRVQLPSRAACPICPGILELYRSTTKSPSSRTVRPRFPTFPATYPSPTHAKPLNSPFPRVDAPTWWSIQKTTTGASPG